jgi:ribonuclease HI
MDREKQQWDTNFLSYFINKDMINDILNIPIFNVDLDDSITWIPSKQGTFTVKSTYFHLISKANNTMYPDYPWKRLWRIHCPAKLKFLAWFMIMNAIPTSENLYNKYISPTADCSLCCKKETSYNFFNECDAFTGFRRKNNIRAINHMFFFTKPQTLVADYMFILWEVWKKRNEAIFQGKQININDLNFLINNHQISFIMANQQPKSNTNPKCVINFKWEKPPTNWFKLNTDGAKSSTTLNSGIGGIIRNDQGEFVCAYAQHTGSVSNNMAEILAIREGLHQALILKIRKLIIETDSTLCFDAINRKSKLHPQLQDLVKQVWTMLQQLEEGEVQFVFRESNNTADLLAKHGRYLSNLTSVYFNSVPSFLCKSLDDDLSLLFSRSVCTKTSSPF